MIASLSGVVEQVGLDRLVVVVGGVGMLVHTTPSTAAECRSGHEVRLATTLVVREDSLTLYGFASQAEREMFETVQSVSGVGPRIALAMLSVMGPEDLRRALSEGDTRTLTQVPGIGAKSAERLVLELRDKVSRVSSPGAVAAAAPRSDWEGQVTEALIGLGYSSKQAAQAVARVSAEQVGQSDISTLLRQALRGLRP